MCVCKYLYIYINIYIYIYIYIYIESSVKLFFFVIRQLFCIKISQALP